LDDLLQPIGEMRTPRRLTATERVVREIVRVWEVIDVRQEL
jgi:hypothetical protein